jgi:hypothetical protein
LESEDEKEIDINWTELKPSERDGYQDYVLVAHILIGVIISIISFTGDLVSWERGIGLVTPILIGLTGLAFLLPTGMNWYWDEFLSFANRFVEICEEENFQFLRFERIQRFTVLISGYLATGVCQAIYTLLIAFFSPFWVDLSPTLYPETGLIVGIVILFIILLLVFMAFFELILRTVYPKSMRLSKLEMRMRESLKQTDEDKEI